MFKAKAVSKITAEERVLCVWADLFKIWEMIEIASECYYPPSEWNIEIIETHY